MPNAFNVILYKSLIDPLLAGLNRNVLTLIKPGDQVIDIACGHGTLSLEMARKAQNVTGIDLSDAAIADARRTARRRGIDNVSFVKADASDLSAYSDKTFDVAVTTMAIHQFNSTLAVEVLREMSRVARNIIIADYNYNMRRHWESRLVIIIEWISGKEHYRNFRYFMQHGGISYFTEQLGLHNRTMHTAGRSVFAIALYDC
ncbi:MAG: class I SAM-dependent methyltransferase [Bacteroidales bacterium]|nr:class I SAM-dependent methyltransferase [Bacteroidales bacterium]